MDKPFFNTYLYNIRKLSATIHNLFVRALETERKASL